MVAKIWANWNRNFPRLLRFNLDLKVLLFIFIYDILFSVSYSKGFNTDFRGLTDDCTYWITPSRMMVDFHHHESSSGVVWNSNFDSRISLTSIKEELK